MLFRLSEPELIIYPKGGRVAARVQASGAQTNETDERAAELLQSIGHTDAATVQFYVHFPERAGLRGLYDTVISFGLWHYPFWGTGAMMCGAGLCLSGTLSLRSAALISAAYATQMFVWQPQYRQGLPDTIAKGWMFAPFLDGFMHYSGAHWISEFVLEDDTQAEEATLNKFMFSYAPHGIMGVLRAASGGSTWQMCFGPRLFPRWASFGAAFFIPGIREFSLLSGCVDAGRKTLVNLPKSINLVPGGIREMFLTDGRSTQTKLVVKDRVGFVKLAQQKEMQLVPVLCFGEKWAYQRVEVQPPALRRWLMRNQITGTLLLGRAGTLLPKFFFDFGGEGSDSTGQGSSKAEAPRKKFGWVFGKPIDCAAPGKTVEELHAEYLAAVKGIFERYKAFFGYGAAETLEFVETKVTEAEA